MYSHNSLHIHVLGLCFLLGLALGGSERQQIISEDLPPLSDDAEVTEGFLEGDIDQPTARNAIRGSQYKWPNGIVYYKINSSYPASTRDLIVVSMREIESNTRHGDAYCVRFVERTSQTDYINVVPGTGCHSKIGRRGGVQEVSIGSGCETKGTVMHELIHALGFWHEQSRYDRDNYVVVHTDNIASNNLHDFTKHTSSDLDTLGTAYDLGSILHYGPYAFAVDKSKPSISALPGQGSGVTMGQRLAMSVEDVQKIQKYYGCAEDTSHITRPYISRAVVNCIFASSLCNLQQDHTDNFDWSIGSGSSVTAGTGPHADHTNGGGSYAYAKADGHHQQKARLLFPSAAKGDYCIDFWLYQQEGSFQLLTAGPAINEQVFKTISGQQSVGWVRHRINLHTPSEFHLILQATIANADIAVDDFLLYPGRCL